MKLYTGHVLDVLPALPERSVQCIVTSPPYWGLRKYAGEQEVIWGGKAGCEHKWGAKYRSGDGTAAFSSSSSSCSLCGAWRGALGLEPTPALYIEHSMAVLDALWRVLRDDGVLWWNLGDSYAGKGYYNDGECAGKGGEHGQKWSIKQPVPNDIGLKPKDICLIPFRFALAAQEHGWWVRSDIIWAKPNPMPESVTDRPTRAHEYIFMLTKAARYYYDAEAVKEPSTGQKGAAANFARMTKEQIIPGQTMTQHRIEREPTSDNGSRNLRSVWAFPTQPYPEAHFATFPSELPRRCILASTSPKACPSCGAPWARIIEKKPATMNIRVRDAKRGVATAEEGYKASAEEKEGYGKEEMGYTKTLGWKPTCSCEGNDGSGRCVVLDPFCGSGTTIQVAEELNREGWGIDISREYRQMSIERMEHVRRYDMLDDVL